MRAPRIAIVAVLAALCASVAPAADQASSAMKKILDNRKDDFSAIRTKPPGGSGGKVYASTVVIPDAKECLVQPETKTSYSDSCDVMESHNKSAVMARYSRYMKEVKALCPAAWITWKEKKPSGEEALIGPDRQHPVASVRWVLTGMNADQYTLSMTFYAEGYSRPAS